MDGLLKTISICIVSLQLVVANWNNPYASQTARENAYFSSFSEPPKTLDPARSYSSNEWSFIAQIYEPPLQYAYLKRPFSLEPLTLTAMPTIQYLDDQFKVLRGHPRHEAIRYTQYDLFIKPGIMYQPHPAFVQDKKGRYPYHQLTLEQYEEVTSLQDFSEHSSRVLQAEDYVNQIKRLADPNLHSPIYGIMSQYIVGLKAVREQLKQQQSFKSISLPGAKAISPYHLRITIKGYYPQFLYWLAMPFFAPIPWEVIQFYEQPALQERHITLSTHPVGTGAFYLSTYAPNRHIILKKNPFYHDDHYPRTGSEHDRKAGLLELAGKRLPFLDKLIFTLEKETLPRWNKFIQGYYDRSGIGNDSFSSAIFYDKQGKPQLNKTLRDRGIQLHTHVELSNFHIGFNMLDSVVGGLSERARLLRLALTLAVNFEEYLQIFRNGRGKIAHAAIPPGIVGYQAEVNPYLYDRKQGQAMRKGLVDAKRYLEEAGYQGGIDPKTGEPLQLTFDLASDNSPENRALYAWLRKAFSRLNIRLHVRATQYNRFQEKIRQGRAQLFFWGWHADYPDPENFLFLLYGKNSKVKYDGENVSNYNSKKYDAAFEKLKRMPMTASRDQLIEKMTRRLQHDAPWMWGFFPINYVLVHQWNGATKFHAVANNTMKYMAIDSKKRSELQAAWNKPIIWPLAMLLALLAIFILPAYLRHRKNDHD